MKKAVKNPGQKYKVGQQTRQGDVLLIKKDQVPKSQSVSPGPTILAEGEQTGHAHELGAGTALIEADDVSVHKDTAKLHEDHDGIAIDVGTWERRGQQQYVLGQATRAND